MCGGSDHGARRRLPALAALTLALAAWWLWLPSLAVAQSDCPLPNPSYMDKCGPAFALPQWTDAAGWSDPSQYATVQLADFNGDKQDELIGRSDQGLEIWSFDKSVGQWRPQVDANGVPQVLTDFRSPLPSEEPATDWTKAEYYSTIQTAHINGNPSAQVLARFADGMRVYGFSPGPGGSINGGSWSLISQGGPFSDTDGWGDPSRYLTIRTGDLDSPGATALIGRAQTGLVGYSWTGSGWTDLRVLRGLDDKLTTFNDANCASPECYALFHVLRIGGADQCQPSEFGPTGFCNAVVGRNAGGVNVLGYSSDFEQSGEAGWFGYPGNGDSPDTSSPAFSDRSGPDCPLPTPNGAVDCLGSSPAYYGTFGVADFDHDGIDEVYARAPDGLRVKKFDGREWTALPTLTDLKSQADPLTDFTFPGIWASIRTADIDGDGDDEVLALDGAALQVWSYDPASTSWKRWQPSTPLSLASPDWTLSAAFKYFGTIRTGDVDGDGHDDVIARGPTGVRTWFYDRRGTGGWERYLPEGLPAFPGGGTPNTGQAAAYDALNAAAKDPTNNVIPQATKTVRDVWASEEPPTPGDLIPNLQTGLITIGNCTGRLTLNPPSYGSCTPPQASSAFDAADWTAVVNKLLAENYAAWEVVNHFATLTTMSQDLFIAQGAVLPAIGGDLKLQAAAASQPQFSMPQLWSIIFGIAGSLAGLAGPEAGAGLAVASYTLSAIPQSSDTAMSSFTTDYAGLADQFGEMVTEAQLSLKQQSQEVRQDSGLLSLVGQLRARGTWSPDTTGIESAADQGFASWIYQELVPTLYNRYTITNCRDGFDDYPSHTSHCSGPAAGTGVVGGGGNFTTIATPLNTNGDTDGWVPCHNVGISNWTCAWTLPPDDLLTRIWGPVQPKCQYKPGTAATAWTFGTCSAGVDVNSSIGDNTWGFATHAGNPDPTWASLGRASTAQAQARAQAPIVLGRRRIGKRRAVKAHTRLSAGVHVPRRLRLAGATVTVKRVLFEPRGRGELTLPPLGDRTPRPLELRLARSGSGRFRAAGRSNRRDVRIALRRLNQGTRVAVDLRASADAFRVPRTCHSLPASVARRTPPMKLETRLVLRDAGIRRRITLFHHVRCQRDARGNVHRLKFVRFREYPARSGLDVTVRGPRRVLPGADATYVARVRNRRSGGSRPASSLWDVTLSSGDRERRIRELRRGRSRSISFRHRAPRAAGKRFCVSIRAVGPGLRPAADRFCARTSASRGPAFTG